MIVITSVNINRYRSILNLRFNIDNMQNLVAICGENNVGKTNTLRAVNLFFNPEIYDISTDRPTLKQAQGGGSIDTKIELEFYDYKAEIYYSITRDFKHYDFSSNNGLSGEMYRKSSTGKTKINSTKKALDKKELNEFLSKFEFRYIESININIPQIVEQLTDDIIDVEYEGTRMTESKRVLREAYGKYTMGLQNILNVFSSDISGTFNDFRENWNISFNVPKSVDTFRDLISDDVELFIDDKGCNGVEQKGSGLQRLAVILLHFEIVARLKKKKNIIICVDEPDIYLHEGLQRKLIGFFEKNSKFMQIIYTTHSKIFINQYSMKNAILLGSNFYKQYSVRKKKEISVAETIFIDTNTEDGYEKICEHLGIEKSKYDILEKNNILVEGGCDKKYLEELGNYFGVAQIKIISVNGVNNVDKYMDFYNSYYKTNLSIYKPKVKILFDNDAAGRDAYKKISAKKYNYVDVDCILLQNHLGDSNTAIERNNCNHEIEDLIYPEVMCYLVNALLEKRNFNKIDTKTTIRKIHMPSFKNGGILSLIDNEKNEQNPNNGQQISFVSSGQSTDQIKNGLAGLFNIQGDRKLINIIERCMNEYPFVRNFTEEIFTFG